MISRIRSTTRALCALPFLACAGESGPSAPQADTAAFVPGPSLSTLQPSESELAEMPSEFHTAPSIFNARTVVAFTDDPGVYAEASMDYYATDAEQDVTLALRHDDREVYSKTARDVREDWLPAWRSLHTMVSFSVSATCGNSADGDTAHRAWHKFIVGSWKYFSWGRHETPSRGTAAQPQCATSPPPGSGGSGGDDPYDTGCESCQQWFWYEYGQIVDEWWECTPIDASYCEGLAT